MSDEIRGILKDFSKHIHVATLSKMGSASPCEEFAREAETFLNQALSAIREAIPRMVDISDKDLGKIIMFIRHSLFLPENDKMAELKKMILSTLCEQVGELIRVKEEALSEKEEK